MLYLIYRHNVKLVGYGGSPRRITEQEHLAQAGIRVTAVGL